MLELASEASHYFHRLRSSPALRKFHALPPVRKKGKYVYYRFRSWPMGSRLSAALAQGISNLAARRAGLPAARRLLPGNFAPLRPPVWGSITDDLCVTHRAGGELVPEDDEARKWCHQMDTAWGDLGIETHRQKALDFATGAEVQGAFVDETEPALSLSAEKEVLLQRSLLLLALQFRPARRAVERALGKVGHARCFRPCLRSIGAEIFRDVHFGRLLCLPRLWNHEQLLLELLAYAVLLPFARMSFTSQWHTRVEASDAAPGGHGRAYTRMSVDEVSTLAASAAHRGDYTQLYDNLGLYMPITAPTFSAGHGAGRAVLLARSCPTRWVPAHRP